MTINIERNRPHITVILAMSADGKIADAKQSPARFSSATDLAHLQTQISLADGVLFGAATLRAYGTTLTVSDVQLQQNRKKLGKSIQPVQIVCSASAKFNSELRFFSQPVPHWLLTSNVGAQLWQGKPSFERIIITEITPQGINWLSALQKLTELGLERLAVIGGGNLVASLLAENLIDEFWLTICPIILGGTTAPTPVEGVGFLTPMAPRLELLSVDTIGQEVFLHYRLQ